MHLYVSLKLKFKVLFKKAGGFINTLFPLISLGFHQMTSQQKGSFNYGKSNMTSHANKCPQLYVPHQQIYFQRQKNYSHYLRSLFSTTLTSVVLNWCAVEIFKFVIKYLRTLKVCKTVLFSAFLPFFLRLGVALSIFLRIAFHKLKKVENHCPYAHGNFQSSRKLCFIFFIFFACDSSNKNSFSVLSSSSKRDKAVFQDLHFCHLQK